MGLALKEKDKDKKAIEFYEAISRFRICPSTPTLFNSGSVRSHLSSSYLNTFEDSIDGIFEGAWQEARKSKFAGGLGFDVTNFRSAGSTTFLSLLIRGASAPERAALTLSLGIWTLKSF